ncbi:hypothetical protein ACJMK2_018466 [Sinanodonta woodiana]|uniref:Uncharacterized protein n=1 Tax=Sinanodonta woodiana TaxID=1069815 RepID=A0ABD3UHF2_SINWO
MVEYETKRDKFTVYEFYKRNNRKLPQIVMATQSVGGTTEAEAFEYKQVFRIHSICRSRRVSALQPSQQDAEECTYSFPVDSTILFCLDENLHQNEKERLSLAEILEKKTLPVDVHFAQKGIVNIGENTFSTSHFSNLRLINVSEEIYLLGNYIFDDELDLKIVQIPINISTIKFAEVTGLKGKTASDWKTLQRKLDRKASQLNFDAFAGNPSKEFSKSKSDGADTEDDIDDVVSLNYENFQTSKYTRIKKSTANVQATHNGIENSKDNTYEFMAPIPLDRVTKHRTDQTENKPNQSNPMNQRKYTHTLLQDDNPLPNVGELIISSEKRSAPRKLNEYSAIPQRACPKSKHSSHADAMKYPHKEQFTPSKVPCIGVGDSIPPEIPRPTACKLLGTERGTISSTAVLDSYENTRIGLICPTTNTKPNELIITKGKEKNHGKAIPKTTNKGVIQNDVDTEYENLAKYKREATRVGSDGEGEHISSDYENSGEIRGTNITSLSETGSGVNDDLYETMSSPGFIKK